MHARPPPSRGSIDAAAVAAGIADPRRWSARPDGIAVLVDGQPIVGRLIDTPVVAAAAVPAPANVAVFVFLVIVAAAAVVGVIAATTSVAGFEKSRPPLQLLLLLWPPLPPLLCDWTASWHCLDIVAGKPASVQRAS